jgi:soluble lytic murein transglycosylase-like protein
MNSVTILLALFLKVQTSNLSEPIKTINNYSSIREEVIFNFNNALYYDPYLRAVAEENNLDPNLIRAVIIVESKFNPAAVSTAGAEGLMQLTLIAKKQVGVGKTLSPTENIEAGVSYFKYLLDRFESQELALAAYNAGPTCVRRYKGIPPYIETKNYVRKVMKIYNKLI